MPGAPHDPIPIAPPDYTSDDPQARRLRDYWRARDRGDNQAAITLWDDVLVYGYDRMRGKIESIVARRKVVYVALEEVDDVAQEAFARARGMALTFEQRSLGQLRAALIKTAQHTTLDYNRARAARQRLDAGSFDERRDYGDGVADEYNPYEAQVIGWDADATADLVERRADLDRIAAAIHRLPNENMRNVLNLTQLGFDSNTIADQLGLNRDNVDQLRSRGVRKLKELLNDDSGS
jgi:RNA polymerase sigma factor (sigma-70 family)